MSSPGDRVEADAGAAEGAAKDDFRVRAGTVLGSFRIIEPIGSGGMGEVYRAEHVYIPDRPAALKVMHPHRRRGDFEKRFHSEASKLANLSKLKHPNIVEFYDANIRDDGLAWIAMELLRGAALDAILVERGRLAIPDALSILGDVADGLHAAHLCKLIHRDLKLQNLFLTTDQIPKILDFGTAKLTEDRPTLRQLQPSTQENVVIGTWQYMSPEQLLGEPRPLDHRSDIFSLGVIFYELLTGEHPFALPNGEGGVHELGYRACIQPPHAITNYLPDCPTDVWMLVFSMLEKNRNDRPASMAKVAEKMRQLRSLYLVDRGLPVAPLAEVGSVLDRAHAPTAPAPKRSAALPANTVRMGVLDLGDTRPAPTVRLAEAGAPAQPEPRSAPTARSIAPTPAPISRSAVPAVSVRSAGGESSSGKGRRSLVIGVVLAVTLVAGIAISLAMRRAAAPGDVAAEPAASSTAEQTSAATSEPLPDALPGAEPPSASAAPSSSSAVATSAASENPTAAARPTSTPGPHTPASARTQTGKPAGAHPDVYDSLDW